MDINHFIRSPSNLLVLRITFNDGSVRELELNTKSAAELAEVLFSYSLMAFESKPAKAAPVLELAQLRPLREAPDCEHGSWVHTESGQSYCRDCGLACAHPLTLRAAGGIECGKCHRAFGEGE